MLNEILTVTEKTFPAAVAELTGKDQDLARVVAEFGEPPFFFRPPGFQTLIHIILEQQVSLASAKAAFERTKQKLGADFTPADFLKLSDEELRQLAFSRQKSLYSRNLANAIVAGDLNLELLETAPDDVVAAELTKLKGIGRWTADVYLLMCLRRADAFPIGDLGLIVGVQTVKKLPERPIAAELLSIGEAWRPLRAVATRIIWHYYLKKIRPYADY